jgi:Flp pilus assembly protein TadG
MVWTKLRVERLAGRGAAAFGRFRAFLGDQAGSSIIVIGLTMPALVGAMALAAEVTYWHLHNRAMQNAADAAAIAAATSNGPGYATEGTAVASQYGFPAGTGNISVSVTNPATATGCSANCYVVTISDNVPLFFSQAVGYQGGATANGQPASTITASAVATAKTAYDYCILALAGSGKQGIRTNGAPKADLGGCNTMSNTSSTCNGSNLKANVGNAHGTNNGCGISQNSNVPTVSDPYSGQASNIPANTCSSYPQEPTKKNDPALPDTNLWNGAYSLSGHKVVCGDQQLTGNTIINATSGAVLVIENGQLDTNGFTFKSGVDTGLTIVFSGANNPNYQHIPSGGGTLDIAAPTSGVWSGIAIYQDPSLTTNVDISAAGNSPTWNISGLVYLPHSSITLSGAVNKSSNGLGCFELVIDNMTINGTGSIFSGNYQCSPAGLNRPRGGSRGTLVN